MAWPVADETGSAITVATVITAASRSLTTIDITADMTCMSIADDTAIEATIDATDTSTHSPRIGERLCAWRRSLVHNFSQRPAVPPGRNPTQFEPPLKNRPAQLKRPQPLVARDNVQLPCILRIDPSAISIHLAGIIEIRLAVIVYLDRVDLGARRYFKQVFAQPPGRQRLVNFEHKVPVCRTVSAVFVEYESFHNEIIPSRGAKSTARIVTAERRLVRMPAL